MASRMVAVAMSFVDGTLDRSLRSGFAATDADDRSVGPAAPAEGSQVKSDQDVCTENAPAG
jgi:hypothetical protein